MTSTDTDRTSHRLVPVAVAAALAAVLLGALLVVTLHRTTTANKAAAVSDRRQAVAAAASQIAVDFTTIDYKTLTHDLKRIASVGTPQFRSQTLDAQSNQLAELIITAKGSSVGQVVAEAVGTVAPTTAEAFVAVNAHVVNTTAPNGAEQYYRLDVKLQKVGGRWLASSVNTLA